MTSLSLAIVIPTYNVGDYIGATLDSLAMQSVQPKQIIIIDDGSTDTTVDIIRGHRLFDAIELREQPNQGQGVARNEGVKLATTEYIYFLDSDDLVTEDFVESIQSAIVQSEHADLLFFSGRSFNDEKYSGSEFSPKNYLRPFNGIFASQSEFFENLLQVQDLSCSPCLYVSRTKLWQDCGLVFNHYYHEDEELFYRLIFTAKSYFITSQVYFLRRLRDGSTMTGSKSQKHAFGMHALLSSLLVMAKNYGEDPLKLKLIRRRLRRFVASYIITCKSANVQIDYKLVWQVALQIRHPRGHMSIIRALVTY